MPVRKSMPVAVPKTSACRPLHDAALGVGCLCSPRVPTRSVAEAAKGVQYDFSVELAPPFVRLSDVEQSERQVEHGRLSKEKGLSSQ